MQIKSNRDEVYLTLMYNREEEIKEENWESERKRERKKEKMRGRTFLSFSGCSYMGCKKPFIGFIIWTPITYLKDE